MAQRTCPTCNQPFEAAPKGTGPAPTYCSTRCRNRADYLRRREAIGERRRSESKKRREGVVKECPQCGSSFSPARTAKQRFCCKSCGSAFGRDSPELVCSEPECTHLVRAKGLCSTHYNDTHPEWRGRRDGSAESRRKALRVKSAKRRANERGLESESVDRDVVGERDGWVCGICSVHIDRQLRYPDLASASLDHILPVSLGGPHTYENSRIAHLACNVKRGNRIEPLAGAMPA